MGTPNRKHWLRARIIIDDGGQPKQLRDWVLTYVFGFNLYELLVKVYEFGFICGFDLIIVGYFI